MFDVLEVECLVVGQSLDASWCPHHDVWAVLLEHLLISLDGQTTEEHSHLHIVGVLAEALILFADLEGQLTSVAQNQHWDLQGWWNMETNIISMAPGRCASYFKNVLFNLSINAKINIWGTPREIALSWMPQNFINKKSKLVQIMAWCGQATRHCLSQCWHRSMSPYGVTMPQWVNCVLIRHTDLGLVTCNRFHTCNP